MQGECECGYGCGCTEGLIRGFEDPYWAGGLDLEMAREFAVGVGHKLCSVLFVFPEGA